MEALIESFDKVFEIVPVVTDEQLHEALRLRYQVYCLETGFESVDEHPDGMERDEFDHRSAHSLLIHRQSGLVAGTVRLVLPNTADLQALFPIEKGCGARIKRPIMGPHRAELGEISRFCISRDFKRRVNEAGSLWGTCEDDSRLSAKLSQRRVIPHISLGLIAATIHMSLEHGVRFWYALMEPSLVRLLQRFGIYFEPIGPMVDYHGERQPCFALRDQVLGSMRAECYPAWELATAHGTKWPAMVTSRRQRKDSRSRQDIEEYEDKKADAQ